MRNYTKEEQEAIKIQYEEEILNQADLIETIKTIEFSSLTDEESKPLPEDTQNILIELVKKANLPELKGQKTEDSFLAYDIVEDENFITIQLVKFEDFEFQEKDGQLEVSGCMGTTEKLLLKIPCW